MKNFCLIQIIIYLLSSLKAEPVPCLATLQTHIFYSKPITWAVFYLRQIPTPAPPPPTYASPPPLIDATTPASDASALTNPTTITNFLANSMQQRENDLQSREQQLLLQMQEMMSRMLSSTPTNNTRSRTAGNCSHGPCNGPPSDCQRQTNRSKKYCWTHGACAHAGTDCLNKAAGHKPQATFTNMDGGSTTGCYWLTT